MGADITEHKIVRFEHSAQIPYHMLRPQRPGGRAGQFGLESLNDGLAGALGP